MSKNHYGNFDIAFASKGLCKRKAFAARKRGKNWRAESEWQTRCSKKLSDEARMIHGCSAPCKHFGAKGRFANALRQARRRILHAPSPKCRCAALAIMHYAREEAVQFANFQRLTQLRCGRNSQMQFEWRPHSLWLCCTASGSKRYARLADPESPSGLQARLMLTQQRRSFRACSNKNLAASSWSRLDWHRLQNSVPP